MKQRKRLAALLASSALIIGMFGLSTGAVSANDPIYWTGNGTTDGQLDDEQCDDLNTPYLYWVFASSKGVTSATLHFGGTGSGDYPMNDDNGTWKLQDGPWFELDGLIAWVTFEGTPENNPHLTISHGCPGETEESQPPSEEPSFEESQEVETEAPSEEIPSEEPSFEESQEVETEAPSEEIPSEEPSFEQSQLADTDAPSEPDTATVGGHETGAPSDSAWLLVIALGLLLSSIVVMTPARARSRR